MVSVQTIAQKAAIPRLNQYVKECCKVQARGKFRQSALNLRAKDAL